MWISVSFLYLRSLSCRELPVTGRVYRGAYAAALARARLARSRAPVCRRTAGPRLHRGGGEGRIMAGSVNKVILVGNLGKDPDVRRLNSGDQVVSFSALPRRRLLARQGSRASARRPHRMAQCRDLQSKRTSASVAEQYCKKGTKVYLEGQLQTRKWQDQSGADRYTTEVVLQRFRGELQLLDSRGGGARVATASRGRSSPQFRLQPRTDERAPSGALQRRGRGGRRDRRRHSVLTGLPRKPRRSDR